MHCCDLINALALDSLSVPDLWKASYYRRANQLGDGNRQLLPYANGKLVAWILVIYFRQGTTVRYPISPVQGDLLAPPLLLKAVRSRTDRRPPEIENAIPSFPGKAQDPPIKKHV